MERNKMTIQRGPEGGAFGPSFSKFDPKTYI